MRFKDKEIDKRFQEKINKRCRDCVRIEPFMRKGFLWWCVCWGYYINPNSYASKFCFIDKDDEDNQ